MKRKVINKKNKYNFKVVKNKSAKRAPSKITIIRKKKALNNLIILINLENFKIKQHKNI
jgi:hypothetical protein